MPQTSIHNTKSIIPNASQGTFFYPKEDISPFHPNVHLKQQLCTTLALIGLSFKAVELGSKLHTVYMLSVNTYDINSSTLRMNLQWQIRIQ